MGGALPPPLPRRFRRASRIASSRDAPEAFRVPFVRGVSASACLLRDARIDMISRLAVANCGVNIPRVENPSKPVWYTSSCRPAEGTF